MKVKIQRWDDTKSSWFIRKYRNSKQIVLALNESATYLKIAPKLNDNIFYFKEQVKATRFSELHQCNLVCEIYRGEAVI